MVNLFTRILLGRRTGRKTDHGVGRSKKASFSNLVTTILWGRRMGRGTEQGLGQSKKAPFVKLDSTFTGVVW